MFAQDLKVWWTTQTQFHRRQEFAAEVGTCFATASNWFNGSKFPKDPLCARLYQITKLPCFSLEGRIAARREHELKRKSRNGT